MHKITTKHHILLQNVRFQIKKVNEMSISANQEREEMEKKRLVWKAAGSSNGQKASRGGPIDPVKLIVELAPMEIRTFVIRFSSELSMKV